MKLVVKNAADAIQPALSDSGLDAFLLAERQLTRSLAGPQDASQLGLFFCYQDPARPARRRPDRPGQHGGGQGPGLELQAPGRNFHPTMPTCRRSPAQRAPAALPDGATGCESNYYANNDQYHVHYIYGGDGLCAITVTGTDGTQTFAVYKDHLGSILQLRDAGGSLVAAQNFDAWGRNRNPADWTYTNIPSVPVWLYRGFTGHEHLPQFGLVNMNGRIYDPAVGRMLSPDNFTGNPLASGSYNRYSYANNNPLRYTDPDGNMAELVVFAIYVAVYAATNLAIESAHGNVHDGSDVLRAVGVGALQGAFSYLLAGTPTTVGWSLFANAGLTFASSYVPPATIPIGNSVTLSISPTFGFGVGAGGAGFGVGLRTALTVSGPINDVKGGTYSATIGAGFNDYGFGAEGYVFGGGSAGFQTVNKHGKHPANWTISAYGTSFTGPQEQKSWQFGIKRSDWSFRINEDVGFSDKYRTFAAETAIGDYMLGTQVYTTEHNKQAEGGVGGGTWSGLWKGNRRGSYLVGEGVSSPLYIGYKQGDRIYRFGLDHSIFQDALQNGLHRIGSNTPNFMQQTSMFFAPAIPTPYFYFGSYNPYFLY